MGTGRNFNSISPSAKGLLMTKAMSTIPFAREAAAVVWDSDSFTKMLKDNAQRDSFGWLLHFENRYRTIDTLLTPLETSNILEIASGFSFRGLQLCTEEDVVYIDTDLAESMVTKKELVDKIVERNGIYTKGKLMMEPLNALLEEEFNEVTGLFPPGALTIVNEGLLMYLDETEKRQLCTNIHKVLKKRGGSWITGDIYLKRKDGQKDRAITEHARAFLAYHKVEEKKFDSYEAAEAFFKDCGFVVAQKETVDFDKLSTLRYFEDENIPEDVMKDWFKRRQTWKLVLSK